MLNKRCGSCKTHKSVLEFTKSSKHKDGLRTNCKECRKIESINYRKKYPEKYKENYQRRNKNKLEYLYGITNEEYYKRVAIQNNRCLICNSLPDKQYNKLCVDHCHRTGKIRGLLCSSCNLGLGKFKDDIVLLQKASEYLKGTN